MNRNTIYNFQTSREKTEIIASWGFQENSKEEEESKTNKQNIANSRHKIRLQIQINQYAQEM